MMWAAFIIVALATASCGFEDTNLDGIAFVQETVGDLHLSIRFYTEVLDGLLIPEFRVRKHQSNSDYYRFFQKEILDARNVNVLPENFGVPDIRTGGKHVVNWDFILFDNSLIWLIQFTDRLGNLFHKFDPNVGTAKTGYGHFSLFASPCVNPYQMLKEIYDREVHIGSRTAGLITRNDHSSFTERNAAVLEDITIALPKEDGGFRFAATRGPNGEKIEFSVRRGDGFKEPFSDFCKVNAVHSAMLADQCPKLASQYGRPPVQTNGFHHVEITVPNNTIAVDFYTNIIGGKNPATMHDFQIDNEWRNMLFQDDLLSAKEFGLEADASFGFVEISSDKPNAGSMDFTFVNFENFYLEFYTFNPSDPADVPLLERAWSSPAYRNVVSPGFWVKSSVPLAKFIKEVENAADGRGYTKAKANRATDVTYLGEKVNEKDYSRPFTTGTLSGFDFTFAKGPAGEQISYAKFDGRAGQILQLKYKIYGGVSVAYPETNPYTWGGFNEACGLRRK